MNGGVGCDFDLDGGASRSAEARGPDRHGRGPLRARDRQRLGEHRPRPAGARGLARAGRGVAREPLAVLRRASALEKDANRPVPGSGRRVTERRKPMCRRLVRGQQWAAARAEAHVSGGPPKADWKRAADGIGMAGIAVFLLLNTTGVLPWSFWIDAIALWPLLIMSAGIKIAFEKTRAPWLVLLGPGARARRASPGWRPARAPTSRSAPGRARVRCPGPRGPSA